MMNTLLLFNILAFWPYVAFGAVAFGILLGIRWFELSRRQLRQAAAVERAKAEEQQRQAEKLEAAFRELKQKNDEVIAAQQKLIVQDKLATLGQLTAGIAHEIKNPLNFVVNFSEVSEEIVDELEEELKKHEDRLSPDAFPHLLEMIADLRQNLADIHSHGKRAGSIIRNMMDHSRGTPGERRPVDINRLLDENLNLAYHGYRALYASFNVDIRKCYDESLPPAPAIAQDLGRVLLNILNNACYAVYEKQQALNNGYLPVLTVTTRHCDGYVQIRIRDNGPGIPPEIREKVFTPFFTTKPAGEGNTGLGLAISREIVEDRHGGRLEVESEAGAFTEFVVRLPL